MLLPFVNMLVMFIDSPLIYLHTLVGILSILLITLFGGHAWSALIVALSAPVRPYVTTAQIMSLAVFALMSLVFPIAAFVIHTLLARDLLSRRVAALDSKLDSLSHASATKT